MYNENNKNYFFRDLIVKILIVLLFIFLLMWLMPMPNLNPFYDKIFAQNITTMTDAAKSYFTVSKLPKEGEVKKLTLEDMLNNKMLIEFTDSDGKTCDPQKSYVEVTKEGSEYIFKTFLSCGEEEDYVIEYFGCYDVCEDGTCNVEVGNGTDETKKVTEYKFYRIEETKYIEKYVCADGYTLKDNKCIKESEVEKIEDASLKCKYGYAYNKENNRCEKIETEKIDATLECPNGYIYASSLNKCVKGKDDVVDADLSYKCTDGILVGNKCIVNDVTVVNAEKVYTCSEGILNGTSCIIDGTKTVDAEKVYSCPNGTLSGTKCIIGSSTTVDAEKVYSCSNGTLSGDKGIISSS